ncbi:hypothetical protein D1006_40480 [Burkholderia stabilis]|uniref:Uncharacterized protein n=1 Tax=Burkholderia stabilis TaxID=95485 RepID=A0A4Q2A5H2_9BURK|nr:neuraminidase-like domain-containing protein [Burkholderia stabilis]RXV64566.1 hypothetical protein D1006_40480 [Burkholderia stabilis]
MSTLEGQLEARHVSESLREALADAGEMSVQEAAALMQAEALPANLAAWRDEIVQAAAAVRAALRDAWVSHDPTTRASPHYHEPDPELRNLPVESGEFCDPDSLQSQLSPARYLMQIYRTATKRITPTENKRGLAIRRPDLQDLALSSDNLLTEVTTLSLANQVMEARAKQATESRDDLYKKLATASDAFSLPFDWHQTHVRLGLAVLGGGSLNDIARATGSNDNVLSNTNYTLVPNPRDRLGLCDEDMSILFTTTGAEDAKKLWIVENFLAHTSLSWDELNLLICSSGVRPEGGSASQNSVTSYYAKYINRAVTTVSAIGVTKGTSGDERDKLVLTRTSRNADKDELANMARMARLYLRTGLAFHELDHLISASAKLAAASPPALIPDALSLIARYREWHTRFDLSVDAYAGLLHWSNSFAREGFQETSYLRQLYGDDAVWIADYCGRPSERTVYLRREGTGVSRLTANEIAALQRGLQLTQTDWDTIVNQIDPSKSRVFDWPCLAALHRFALPFRWFRWPVQEAVRMLKLIAPALLTTLSGNINVELRSALDRLVWLYDTLTGWQATPAQIAAIVQTEPFEGLQATQETANWLNNLYQNLLPAQLTAASFESFETVPLDTSNPNVPTVTINWLTELAQDRGSGSNLIPAVIDSYGLVKNYDKAAIELRVRAVLSDKGASQAEATREGVIAILLMGQASAKAVLSTAVSKVMSGVSDTVIPLLDWMNLESQNTNYYEVLTTLLAWHLTFKRAIDVPTLNKQTPILTLLANLSRYAEAVRLFRLEPEDIRLIVDRPGAFAVQPASPAPAQLKLDFNTLLALGQLKGLQHDQASADAWRMYFARRATIGSDTDEKTKLTQTLSELLRCTVDELTPMLTDLVTPAGDLPDTVKEVDLLHRHLMQARALALDYAQLKPLKTMATRTGTGSEGDAPTDRLRWAAKRSAAEAVMTGVARSGASAGAVEHPFDEACRDALVGYLLKKALPADNDIKDITNAEQLYGYLLLDVNVSSEVSTTRLLEAISSVQLYINRALEGAEPAEFKSDPVVSGEASDDAKRKLVDAWAIDREYRLWQANQELALFPAHYVDPEWIQGASADYTAFAEALNQGRLEDDVIRQALSPYLMDLSGRGRGTIGGLSQVPGPDSGSVTLYVTARTPGDAGDWYLRTLTLTETGPKETLPWEKIDVAIPRDEFSIPTPIVFGGAIHVLWVECNKRHEQAPNAPPGSAIVFNRYLYRIRRARRLEAGRWDEPESLPTQKLSTFEGLSPTLPNATEFFSSTPPRRGRLASRMLTPDQWSLFWVKDKDEDSYGLSELDIAAYIDPNQFGAQFVEALTHATGPRILEIAPAAVLGQHFLWNQREYEVSAGTPPTKLKFSFSIYKEFSKGENPNMLESCIFSHHIAPVNKNEKNNFVLSSLEIYEPSGNFPVYSSTLASGWVKSFRMRSISESGFRLKINTDSPISISPAPNTVNSKVFKRLPLLGGGLTEDPCFASDLGQASSSAAQSAAQLTWRFDNFDAVNKTYAATDGTSPFSFRGPRPADVTGPSASVPAIAIDNAVQAMRATPRGGIDGANYSLSFWFRTGSHAQPVLAVHDATCEVYEWIVLTHGGGVSAQRTTGVGMGTSSIESAAGTRYDDNQWHHCVYSCSLNDGQTLYVDGRRQATSRVPSPLGRFTTIELAMTFGSNLTERETVDSRWRVELAELKLFDRALTPAEIGTQAAPRGVALRLRTQTAAQLSEKIEPPVGERPFLYKAKNYKSLQQLDERDATLLISAYNTNTPENLLPVTVWPSAAFDFGGYDGRYGWELFLYMPWLVAQRLASTGDYDHARQWLHCIFDPTQVRPADRWICRPLRESLTAPASTAVTDPDAIARSRPIHYRTAMVNAYTDVLIAAGDAQYRNPTRESLSRAKMYYVMAGQVRGPKPLLLLADDWSSPKLAAAGDNHFKRPVDEKNLAYWDTLEARLGNLRHNRSIDGHPLNLPLLAPPLSPAALQQGAVSGGTSVISAVEPVTPIPHYRFKVMLEKARGFVATLSSLGNALQQTLERDDSEALGLMQLEQQVALIDLGRAMQHEQIEMAQHTLSALQHSRTAARERYTYYHALHEQGISAAEQAAMDLTTSAGALRIGASVPFTVAGVLEALPNIFGLAIGGQQPAGIPRAVGTGMLGVADMLQITADRLIAVEQYRRRSDDWQLQYQQAEREGENLDEQIAGAQRALALAQEGLRQQTLQQEQARATQRFLKQRFGSRALYRWMSGRLATLYWQAYDGATSLCRQAEAACKYELGDFELRFIHAGQAWNDQFRGLLAGEALLLDLQRMEQAHLQRDSRPYEIVKTFSLKAINAAALGALKSAGTAQFELTEALFDQDYPNHYLRQIKTVALSFPAVLGPYQEVGAMLTQLSNTLYYTKDKRSSKTNLRAYQQVALSQGINDSGLFQLDFDDARYLPFEGTGVESNWKLAFPGWKNESGNAAKTLLESLDDVIIQVRYTAAGS